MTRWPVLLAIALGIAGCLPRPRSEEPERLYVAPTIAPGSVREARPARARGPSVLRVEQDEFTRRTALTVEDRMAPHYIEAKLLLDQDSALMRGGALVFYRYSPRWRYLRCSHVDMLIDGEPVDLPDTEHDGEVMDGGVLEAVSVRVSPEMLGALLSAQQIRARICNDAWTFTPRFMRGLGELRTALSYDAQISEEAAGATEAAQ